MANCCVNGLNQVFCNAFNKYYNTLYTNGEISKEETNNLLIIDYIRQCLSDDRYSNYYSILLKALRCIANNSCLLDISWLYDRNIVPKVTNLFVTVLTKLAFTETDPIFSASPAATITEEDIDNWNNPSGGELSDWNETDTSSLAYIKNKPTIPTVPTNVSAFNNDAGYLTQVKTINGSSLVGSGNINTPTTFNGICVNRGNVKISTIDNYSLRDGNIIVIYFLNNDVITGSTLNISNTGAKNILYDGPTPIVTGIIKSNDTAVFVYSEEDDAYVLLAVDKWQLRKQDTLISGTNIKSINNTSILGNGNIDLVPTSTFNSFCPIIEDTRSSAVAAITGVAPFSTLVDGQRIILHLKYKNAYSPTLTLTLSGGTDTNAIPIRSVNFGGIQTISASWMQDGAFYTLIYDQTNTRWLTMVDKDTVYPNMPQSVIDAGTDTYPRMPNAKLIHDNAYIVEETYTSGSLKANKFYDFGTVSSLTIPTLDATNDLVSNALNFYALRFIAGADNLSITFPTGVIVDDEPTINTGDYVEIMINLYAVNGVNNFYASIKVWQTQ